MIFTHIEFYEGFTLNLFNLHALLDTFIFLGSIATNIQGEKRIFFILEAIIASFSCFFCIGYGARYLRRFFESPLSWKTLDIIIGIFSLYHCYITFNTELEMNIKTYITLLLLGIICSLGQPPYNFILPAIFSLALFFHLLELSKNKNNAFWAGYWFGYGYYVYSHNWFSSSLFAYGEQLLWLYPFGIIFIPAFFALYFALAGLLIYKYAYKNIFLIAIIWIFMELVRSYGYIELPWLLIGYIWSNDLIISQSTSLFGIYGLSFLTILWAGAFKEAYPLKDKAIVFTAIISFILCQIYGNYHLKEKTISQDVKIRIIQPNIDQNIESRIKNRYSNLIKAIDLSISGSHVDYVIWPEGANEFQLNEPLLDLLKKAVPKNGHLVFNSNRIEENPYKTWNSMITIDDRGKIVDYYDKIHLVPLGEYIPLRSILPFINKITPGSTDFSEGKALMPVKTSTSFLPSICYEASFIDFSKDYYTWIVNITNDGWFGDSIGPSQHLSIAKFRAIELGVPMARSALTGVSAVIDSFGRVVKQLPLLSEGFIETKLPDYIEEYTFFRKHGLNALNYLTILIIAIIFMFVHLGRFAAVKNKEY